MAWRVHAGLQEKRDFCFAEHWDLQPEPLRLGIIRRRLAAPTGHIPRECADAWSIPGRQMPAPHFRSRFHEHRLRSLPRNKCHRSPVLSCEAALACRRSAMRKFESRRPTSKTMIVVAASLALGTAMMATATLAFARSGGGGHSGGGHFAARHFGRGFGGDFGRPYGFGSDGLHYDDGSGYGNGYSGCYVPTPDGYAWACY